MGTLDDAHGPTATPKTRAQHHLTQRCLSHRLLVKRDEQIQGLMYLLTLGVRVLSVMEFTLRRSVQKDHTEIVGLHPDNCHKGTDKPTAEQA